MKYECGSLKRNSSVPPSLFLFSFFSFFSFLFIFGGLHGSFYLTLICPLWDLLIFPLWDIFLTLGATLYILQEYRRSFTLYKSIQHKEEGTIMMYASASVARDAMILVHHVAIIRARPNYHAAHRSSKSMYEIKIK